jgi:hypothetical protein
LLSSTEIIDCKGFEDSNLEDAELMDVPHGRAESGGDFFERDTERPLQKKLSIKPATPSSSALNPNLIQHLFQN